MADALTKNNERRVKVDYTALEKAVLPRATSSIFNTGEVLFEASENVPADCGRDAQDRGINEIEVIFPEWDLVSDILLNTVRKDTSKSFEAAIIEIYRRMRPGDPPTLRVGQDALRRHVLRRRASTTSRASAASSSTSSSIPIRRSRRRR